MGVRAVCLCVCVFVRAYSLCVRVLVFSRLVASHSTWPAHCCGAELAQPLRTAPTRRAALPSCPSSVVVALSKLFKHYVEESDALVCERKLIVAHLPALEVVLGALPLVADALHELMPLQGVDAPPRGRLTRLPPWLHLFVAEGLRYTPVSECWRACPAGQLQQRFPTHERSRAQVAYLRQADDLTFEQRALEINSPPLPLLLKGHENSIATFPVVHFFQILVVAEVIHIDWYGCGCAARPNVGVWRQSEQASVRVSASMSAAVVDSALLFVCRFGGQCSSSLSREMSSVPYCSIPGGTMRARPCTMFTSRFAASVLRPLGMLTIFVLPSLQFCS